MKNSNSMQKLTLELTGINFYDADSNFTIASAAAYGENNDITLVGYLKGGIPGEVIEAKGVWRQDEKNERRFYVESFSKSLPLTQNGVLQYLSSGIINEIDKPLAKEIVREFGAKTFDIFEKDSAKLTVIPLINTPKAAAIAKAWQNHREVSTLTDFLHNVSISPIFAALIYNALGSRALEQIKANPFIIAPYIKGLGPLVAAFIARQLGITISNQEFSRYGLLGLMENLAEKGYVYQHYAKLLSASIKKLGVKPAVVADTIALCAANGELVIEDLNHGNKHFVLNNKAVYLKKYHNCETGLAISIKQHLKAPLHNTLKTLNFNKPMGLNDTAKKNLQTLLTHKISIINESIGKNKLLMLAQIKDLCIKNGLKLTITPVNPKLARTAGKTQFNPTPLHKLLEYDAATGLYNRNAQNPLNCDVLLVMRASLLTNAGLYNIMQALPQKATLILCGDGNHLPPAGPGHVFHDLLESGLVPAVSLQDYDADMNAFEQAIRALSLNQIPAPPLFKPFERMDQNFYFIEQDKPEKIIKTIASLCAKRLPKAYGYDLLDIQVIALSAKGPLGAKKLNLYLQEKLNKRTGGLKYNGFIFKVNDKVAQTCDNMNKGVNNCQTGVIKEINMVKKEIRVRFENRTVTYCFHELNELRPAYATAVTKTGISLHKIVVLPLHCDAYTNLNRVALYTAFASAGETLIVVGQKRAFKIALENHKSPKRLSGLQERLLT